MTTPPPMTTTATFRTWPDDKPLPPELQAAHDRISEAHGRACLAVVRPQLRRAQEAQGIQEREAREALAAQMAQLTAVGAGEGRGEEK